MTDRELLAEQHTYHEGSAPASATKPPKTMREELRSSGLWSLGFGAFNILFSSFSSGFGAMLLIVGAASMTVQSASLFIVIGVAFAWAAVSNLLLIHLGDYSGIFWAVVQVPVAYNMMRKFGRYRMTLAVQEPETLDSLPRSQDRAALFLPLSGCLLSAIALPGLFLSFMLIGLLLGPNPAAEPPGLLLFSADLFVNLGVLAVGLGVASLLSGYRFKLLSLAAVLAGSLPVLARIYFVLAD